MKSGPQAPLLIAADEARARALSLVGWSNFLIFESGRPRQSIDPQGRTCFRGTLPPIFALGLFSVATLFSFAGWRSWTTLSVLQLPRSPWDWLYLAFAATVALASGWLGVRCILWRRWLIVDARSPSEPMLMLRERSVFRVTEIRAALHSCTALRTRITVRTRHGRGRSVPTLQILLPGARPFLLWQGIDSAVEAAGVRWTDLTGHPIAAG